MFFHSSDIWSKCAMRLQSDHILKKRTHRFSFFHKGKYKWWSHLAIDRHIYLKGTPDYKSCFLK